MDVDAEIRDLLEKTRRTRHEFLQVELQTCFTALQVAQYELGQRNMPTAEREIAAVQKGIQVLERFLPDMEPGAERQGVEATLAELKSAFQAVLSRVERPDS